MLSSLSQIIMRQRPVRAVLLDVDGTLYHQSALRCLMGLELCTLPLTARSWQGATNVWRALSHFRRVREELRSLGEPDDCLVELQYVEAAQRLGQDPVSLESLVAEWLYQRPLKYLRRCRRRGVEAFLADLAGKGIPVGVFSDYPVREKLVALGLAEKVSLALCATDPDINAFKPHPKGFLHACRHWGVPPEEVLYIGDRPEVDAVGAATASMPCAILTVKTRTGTYAPVTYDTFSSFIRLHYALTRNS